MKTRDEHRIEVKFRAVAQATTFKLEKNIPSLHHIYEASGLFYLINKSPKELIIQKELLDDLGFFITTLESLERKVELYDSLVASYGL